MDSTNRSELGGVDDAEKDLKPDNFDVNHNTTDMAHSTDNNGVTDVTPDTNDGISDDGTMLKISHNDNTDAAGENTTTPDAQANPSPDDQVTNPGPQPEPETDSTAQPAVTPIDSSTVPDSADIPSATSDTASTVLTTPASTSTVQQTPEPTAPPASPPQSTPAVPVNPFARPAPNANPFARPAPSTAPTQSAVSQQPQFTNPQGDIILQTDQPTKKSKTPFIILAVISALAIVVLVVIAITFILRKNSPQAQTIPIYNQYANYLISGNNDTNDAVFPDGAIDKSNYYISQIFSSNDINERSTYMSNLVGYYNNFINDAKSANVLPSKAPESNSTIPEVTESDMNNINTKLQQLNLIAPVPFLSTETLVEQFVDNDRSQSSVWVQTYAYYRDLSNNDVTKNQGSLASNYYQLGLEVVSIQLELIQLASDTNCINSRKIDAECMAKTERYANYQQLSERISNGITYQETLINKFLGDVVSISRNMQQVMGVFK